MKIFRRGGLAERGRKRSRNSSKLNLVSLMDIFTILVFFLLVNSSDVEVLQTNKSIQLPDSTSEQRPGTNLVITVTERDIVMAGRPVASIDDILASDEDHIAGLEEELQYQARRAGPLSAEKEVLGRPITILGDRDVSYTVLKKIMTTCAANEYRNISLAVNKVAREPVDEVAAVEG